MCLKIDRYDMFMFEIKVFYTMTIIKVDEQEKVRFKFLGTSGCFLHAIILQNSVAGF